MATAVIGALRVDLDLGTSGWSRGLSQAERDASNMQRRFERVGQGLTNTGTVISAAVTAPFAALIATAIPAARESAEAVGQVEAALRSMGPAAGFTSQQLQDMAGQLQSISTFDDDDILRQVTANMLTFGNVAGEQFERAQRAAVDLSARMGTDLQSAALMLGKALNDPAKGLAALRRVGIQFTAQQQDQIKAMAAAGDTAGAQSVMLAELERQFGGSAQALRDATPGADTIDQWREFQETVGQLALNVLPPLTAIATSVLAAFNGLSPEMQSMAVGAVAIVAALGPLLMILGPIVSAIGAAIPIIAGWQAAFTAASVAAGGFVPLLAPFLPIIAGVAAALAAAWVVWENWDQIAPILQRAWAAVQETLGPPLINLFNALKEAALAVWNSAFVQGIGDVIAIIGRWAAICAESLGSAIPGILQALGSAAGAVFNMIAEAIRFVIAILSGDWQGAWNAAKGFVSAFATGVSGILSGLGNAVVGYISSMVRGIDEWMNGALTRIWNSVKAKIDEVKGYFYGLYDAVVGHSYVPDMVDGIAQQMARLDGVMVDRARRATAGTAAAFRELASEVGPLLDRLFPEAADLRKYREDRALIDRAEAAGAARGGLTPEQAREARRRLDLEAAGLDPNADPVSVIQTDDILQIDDAALQRDLERLVGEIDTGLFDPLENKTLEAVQNFAEMSRGILDSLRGMVSSFKNGDIVGGILGILDLVGQVANMVAGITGKSNPFQGVGQLPGGGGYGGGRALGGPVVAGKTYRVGERGPEWFTPGTGGRITPDGGGGGGNVYHISGNLLTEEFWSQIQQMDEQAAMKGALGGANMVQTMSQKRGRQRLGRGR